MKTKTFMLLFAAVLMLAGCGYTERGTESVAQVKRVQTVTPLICPDYVSADLSLGVMRDGIGSLSPQDIDAVLTTPDQIEVCKRAAKENKLVEVVYDRERFPICTDGRWVRSVKIVE